MTTTRIHILLLAAVQALAFIAAALGGERWAILPAAASVVLVASTLWVPRSAFVEPHPSQRAELYRESARREEETTIVDAPRRRVLKVESIEAEVDSAYLSIAAILCGACGFAFGALGWHLREGWPLIVCGGFTLGGFASLAWWSRCRSTVRDWRDQERERGER